jgi:hypothetical protein
MAALSTQQVTNGGSESASCLHSIKRKREEDWLTQFGNSWVKISDRKSMLLRLAVISNWLDRKGMHRQKRD